MINVRISFGKLIINSFNKLNQKKQPIFGGIISIIQISVILVLKSLSEN